MSRGAVKYISTEMLIRKLGCHTAAGRSFDESLHNKERLINLFHSTAVFADSCRNGRDSHRTAFKFIDYREQNLIIYLI